MFTLHSGFPQTRDLRCAAICSLLLTLCITSCKQQTTTIIPSKRQPTIVITDGYTVPKDSLEAPQVFPVDESKLVRTKISTPTSAPANTNIHPADHYRKVRAGEPRVIIPGTDTFLLPKSLLATGKTVPAGMPEVVVAKDMGNKFDNPGNFSYFNKAQGLRNNIIVSLLEDSGGNLWFGTVGSGVIKYDGERFSFITQNEGLSHNRVSDMLEDRAGNIWIATDQGLNKYDGSSFTHYTQEDGLVHADIESIIEDRNGNLWLGSGYGMTKYDGKTFTSFTKKEGLPINEAIVFEEDDAGNIWFGSWGAGVCMYDGEQFLQYTTAEGLHSDIIRAIETDHAGNLWFGQFEGVARFDGEYFTHYNVDQGFINNYVWDIFTDRSGNVWIGTDAGLAKYDGKRFVYFTEKEGLSNNFVWSILQDRSGSIWIGTYGGGVSKYDGDVFTHITESDGLNRNIINCMLEDRNGDLWFGAWNGYVSRYDGERFTYYTDKEGLSHSNVWSVFEDKDGNLWFGTNTAVCKFDGSSFTQYSDGTLGDYVRDIKQDRAGNMWFASSEGVTVFDGKALKLYSQPSGLNHSNVTALFIDDNGIVWVGTAEGLTRYDARLPDGQGKQFTHFGKESGLHTTGINIIIKDRAGNFWMGTAAEGVMMYDGRRFLSFTMEEGLINNTVTSIVEDTSGNMIFGTRYGISLLTKEKLALFLDKAAKNEIHETDVFFHNYGYEDGFLGVGCMRDAMMLTRDGNIWIGTNDRLTVFHPSQASQSVKTQAPNMQLTAIELFNESIPWTLLSQKKDSTFLLGNGVRVGNFDFTGLSKWYSLPEHLSLAYDNNYLTFNFIGITTHQPEKVMYQYQLEGIDKQWSAISRRNNAPYGNLPPGTFTFKAKAMNSAGYWSDQFQYTFTIRPPWWKTWWMYMTYMIVFIASIVGYIRWREHQLKRKNALLEEKVTIATKEIRIEKEKSDELLLNILPSEVAEELKEKGTSQARHFNEVTVLFTDFKDFTAISEKLSPQDLVNEINYYYSVFDAIISKYDIEKIKTIGDSYMCAGGLPQTSETNAIDTVRAAMEIRDFMLREKAKRIVEARPFFEIRIGCHTGPVVAGIVGVKKYAYDIWGDAVVIASRMESSGEAGKINVSGTTYELIKNEFACEYRGKVEAKHKGLIDMYFVE